jgi:replication factor C small subunit
VDFKINTDQAVALQGQFFARLKEILEEQGVEYQDKVLAKVVKRYYPDWRRLINECQRFAASGSIDSAILADVADINLDSLVRSLKNKEFTVVRKWVVDNINNDPTTVMRKLYDTLYDNLKGASIPEAVLIIAKYSRDIHIVPDQEINLLACLTEIMMSCEFK